MIYDENVFGKCAIIEWNQYKKSCMDSFVLDEEIQINQLEEVLYEIVKLDNESLIYVSTYPIEKNEYGICAYSDMLWVKTKLSCKQLEDLFSKYYTIEPSAIFNLTEEEKNNVELYIGNNFQYSEFEQVFDLFKLDEIKILFWD